MKLISIILTLSSIIFVNCGSREKKIYFPSSLEFYPPQPKPVSIEEYKPVDVKKPKSNSGEENKQKQNSMEKIKIRPYSQESGYYSSDSYPSSYSSESHYIPSSHSSESHYIPSSSSSSESHYIPSSHSSESHYIPSSHSSESHYIPSSSSSSSESNSKPNSYERKHKIIKYNSDEKPIEYHSKYEKIKVIKTKPKYPGSSDESSRSYEIKNEYLPKETSKEHKKKRPIYYRPASSYEAKNKHQQYQIYHKTDNYYPRPSLSLFERLKV